MGDVCQAVAEVRPDQRDRQRAGDGVDEERDLLAPVAAGEEEVPLDEGVARAELVGDQAHRSSSRIGSPSSTSSSRASVTTGVNT